MPPEIFMRRGAHPAHEFLSHVGGFPNSGFDNAPDGVIVTPLGRIVGQPGFLPAQIGCRVRRGARRDRGQARKDRLRAQLCADL